MDDINGEFARTDVALVIGANDVTNPAARNVPDSPIYGMPILDVDKAGSVVVLKRSMASGLRRHRQPALLRREDARCCSATRRRRWRRSPARSRSSEIIGRPEAAARSRSRGSDAAEHPPRHGTSGLGCRGMRRFPPISPRSPQRSARRAGGRRVHHARRSTRSTTTSRARTRRSSSSSATSRPAPVDLDPYTLQLVNGANGTTYLTVDLPAVELARRRALRRVRQRRRSWPSCDLDVGATRPDPERRARRRRHPRRRHARRRRLLRGPGARLRRGRGRRADGQGAAAPAPAQSIARVPDGCDTDENGTDFRLAASTPGASNGEPACSGRARRRGADRGEHGSRERGVRGRAGRARSP